MHRLRCHGDVISQEILGSALTLFNDTVPDQCNLESACAAALVPSERVCLRVVRLTVALQTALPFASLHTGSYHHAPCGVCDLSGIASLGIQRFRRFSSSWRFDFFLAEPCRSHMTAARCSVTQGGRFSRHRQRPAMDHGLCHVYGLCPIPRASVLL
jgi:hypothetical protein